jgi:hypothetical protein
MAGFITPAAFIERPGVPRAPDVDISGCGTVFLFDLVTPRARVWVDEHVCADRLMFDGALAVEHRYAGPLAAVMVADGLIVGGQGGV